MRENGGSGKRGRAVVSASQAPPQVRVQWLLSALGLLGMAALCCGYLALCLLFSQGQWQLLYQPAAAVPATPDSIGLSYSPVHFGANEAGTTELTGWWIPAASGADSTPNQNLAPTTVLYLHDGAGSLSNALPALADLHKQGCAIFAIDYRGFGESQPVHPGEARMVEDARAALAYLETTRHLDPRSIVLWGRGIGATIASQSGAGERLVLEQVNAPAIELLKSDPRTRLLPLRFLLRDHLDAGPSLQASGVAKLFLAPAGVDTRTEELYRRAREPKTLTTSADRDEIQRFLSAE